MSITEEQSRFDKRKLMNDFLSLELVEANHSAAYVRNLRSTLTHFLNWVPTDDVREITHEHVRQWLIEQAKEPATFAQYRGRLSAFFKWLVKEEYLVRSPVDRIRAPKVRRRRISEEHYLTEEELDRLLKAIDHPIYRALVLFGARTGVRSQTLCQIDLSKVDLENKRMQIVEKGEKPRVIFFNEEVKQVLEGLKSMGITDLKVPRTTFIQAMVRAAKKAGIQKTVNIHMLRHTFAAHARIKGIRLEDLKDLLGHESIEMTLIYADIGETYAEREYRRIFDQENAQTR